MLTLFLTHPLFLQHDTGQGHPERPQRLQAIEEHLEDSGLMPLLHVQTVRAPASDEDLLRVHTPAHLATVQSQVPEHGLVWLEADTPMSPDSLQAARFAAYAGIQAVDAVMAGEARHAFCSVRPPGHHATPDRAMGFCIFNNIAVAAAHAIANHGLKRVAIIDFDVHHGNGTRDAFAGHDNVLMCSFFQHPFYPGSGAGDDAANMVNIPLAAGAGSKEVREVVEQEWLPRLEAFKPELILVSAGFDAHKDDNLGSLRLLEEDYAWITARLIDISQRYCNGKLVSMLEGGYNLGGLGRSVVAHIEALTDVGPGDSDDSHVSPQTSRT